MERELDLTVADRSGSFDSGGSVELIAAGPFSPVSDVEALITIALLLLLGIVFSVSPTGQAFFNWVDNLGAGEIGNVRVIGGGGGAEFTIENR